jgi:hypothetical protein
MRDSSFNNISLADSSVINLVYENSIVCIYYRDWQENENSIKFENVLWFEALYLIGQDLSHGIEQREHSKIEEMCRQVGETPNDYTFYSLISASSVESIFSVIAKGFKHNLLKKPI